MQLRPNAASAGFRAQPSTGNVPVAGLWLPEDWQDVTVLVGVSGGADSVALLRALATRGAGRLVVAHFNHALRGEASDADAAFVARLADELALPYETGRAMTSAVRNGLEESARNARYEFFKAAAGRRGARYVATAHTADDQAETVLHRIVRGTGLAGLSGMPRSRPLMHGVSLIRPLLEIRRADLLHYLEQLGQSFRDDATNRDLGFTRNRLRHDLLPQLAAAYNPQVVEALLRLAQLAGEAQEVIAATVDDLMPHCIRAEEDCLAIDCRRLAGRPRYVVRELLLAAWRQRRWPEQAMGFAQWDRLADFVLHEKPAVSMTLPGSVRVCREGGILAIVNSLNDPRSS